MSLSSQGRQFRAPSISNLTVKVRGRVEHLYYSSPRFSAGRLRTRSGDLVAFAGALMVKAQDQVVLHGVWERHPKYGQQLKVSHFTFDQRLDVDGLALYLANHPLLKGIGPVRSKKIAETFGEDFDRVLEEEPARIAEAAKLPMPAVETLRDEWLRTRTVNATLTWLSSFGLTHHQATSLIERLGNSAVTALQTDPYILVREIPGFGFKRVDEVARKLGTAKDDPARLRAGVIHCVAEQRDQGDCWVEYEELIGLANQLLVMDTRDSRVRIEKALDEAIELGHLACVSLGGRFLIADRVLHRCEVNLATIFAAQLRPNPHFAGVKDIGALIAEVAPRLNEAQARAVRAVAEHNMALISGGAGSGKTFSVAAIVKLCRVLGKRVVMAAPTGKAAKRMEQVVGSEAFTIHRLLGYNGHDFMLGPESPIEADVLIIDEVSMVDVALAWRLFRAVALDRTAVVLVGDHNQLPPVGPGNLLRDLIERQPIPTVILEEVVRQAGVLKENSIAVLRGEVRKSAATDGTERAPWVLVNRFGEVNETKNHILELYDSILVDKMSFDLLADVQLLTPTRKGPLGTEALNVDLQRLVQKKLWGVEAPPPRPGRRPDFLMHDRVIQTKNDYDLGVMNGAIGTVTGMGLKRGELRVLFDGKEVNLTTENGGAGNISLAYALTIHRVQGSEFPCAVIVCHKAHSFMHHRNLLYTAVTRARQTAIIVGDQWGIRECAQRQQVERRKTFLSVLDLPESGSAGRLVNGFARPPVEELVRFFEERFFNRTDKVAILAPWGKPAAVRPCGGLRDLLPAHVLGSKANTAKVFYRTRKSSGALSGRFRVGSYCPAPDGTTRWLCIDFDGAGHAHALADPLAAAQATQRAFGQLDLPCYLERSGGGKGWHLWCFFEPPLPAADAQTIARALAPADAPLASGGVADVRSARGIEVFPKQKSVSERGFGNQVWLPYWSGAPEGANVFYQVDASGQLVPFAPTQVVAASVDAVLRAVESLPKTDSKPASTSLVPAPVTTPVPAPVRAPAPSEWDDWRRQALAALPLDSVYGSWLTGKSAGAGWLECRDPGSPSGDENPSASVADGTGEAEKGKFHSFISGATVSIFDFLVEHGGARDFKEAVQRVAELAGVEMPGPPAAKDSPVLNEWLAWAKDHASKNGAGSPATDSSQPESPSSAGGGDPPRRRRPDIQINNRPLDQIVADAWHAVHKSNTPTPAVFRRATSLVRLVTEGDTRRIEDMNEPSVYGLLARVASWIRQGKETFQFTFPSHEAARDMIVYPAKELPMLHGVVNIPVFDNEGKLVATPGYSAHAHLWYHPPFGFQMPQIPDRPSESDVGAAKSLLFDELLVDFPFDDAASRAHMLAALLLPFARRLIVGPAPLHLIQAPQGGSGKGLLVNVLAIVATGHTAIGSSLPENEDEVRKKLTAELASGKPLMVIDNVDKKRQLYSPALLAASTMWPLWTDRLLGQTKMISVPNDAVWVLNGNNPRLSDEVARRCVSIRIVPNTPQPWLRTDFRHPNLVRWTLDNRAQLVHAALILVQNWIAHGRPRGTQTLGSFESWSEVVGGILSAAGVEGFLGNARKLYETTDSETTMWFDLVEAWWEAHKGDAVRVHQLAEMCSQRELMGRMLGEGSERSQAIRLGKALLGARDRVFGTFRIEQAGKDRESKRPMYRLLDVNSGAPPTPPSGQSMDLFASQ